MRQKDLNGRLARWALKLQGFNFNIEHRRGRDNVVPDALSRTFDNDEIAQIDSETLPAIDLESGAFDSEEYSLLREKIIESKLPDYKVVDKFIYYRVDFDETTQWKLVVPNELRTNVIYTCHDPPSSGHAGVAKTLNKIRRYFYWPRMVVDVKRYVQNCELCQTSKTPNRNLRPLMGNMATSDRPFQRLYIDLIGPFPRTKQGNIGICIILDHFSKFTFLKPIKKFESKHIIKILKEDVFHCFGVPEVIISDNGSQFKCKKFEQLLTEFGVKHVLTPIYAPQSNASERVNRSINEALRSYIRSDQREWDTYLSAINSSLRSSLHQSLGKSPYYVLFGQNMVNHGHDYKLLRNLETLHDGEERLDRQDKFSYLRDIILEKMQKAYDKNTKTYNLRSSGRTFDVGQIVTRRNFAQSIKSLQCKAGTNRNKSKSFRKDRKLCVQIGRYKVGEHGHISR